MAGTLDKAPAFCTENAEMPPTDPDNASVEEYEAIYPVEDLELFAAGAKQLLMVGVLNEALFARLEDAYIPPGTMPVGRKVPWRTWRSS